MKKEDIRIFWQHSKRTIISVFSFSNPIYAPPTKKAIPYMLKAMALFALTVPMHQLVNSQPFYFRHYQVENGLSNSTVYSITQDSNGFMWFATKDGLNRFDGFHFKVFRVRKDEDQKYLQTDYIYSVYPLRNGSLWVGAQRGLYRFNPQKEILEPFIDTLSNVYDINVDNKGRLWFISSSTVCRYDFRSGHLKQFLPGRYFNASSLCIKDSTIWVGTENGFLEKYNEKTSSFQGRDLFAHSSRPASRFIQKMYPADGPMLFVGTTGQGLKLFNTETNTYEDVLTYNADKTTIFVRSILQNGKNEYWIGTETGIYIYNTNTKSFINLKKKNSDRYSLNDNAIYALFKDTEGSIWAGTFFGGVNYYAKQNAAFRKYFAGNDGNPIMGNAVREICKDQYGNLWVGTEDGGLNKITANNGSLQNFRPTGKSNSIAYTNIHGLLADGPTLWIGTFEHGIDLMDIKTGTIKHHFVAGTAKGDIKSNFAVCFYRTAEGVIYVGTANGLYRYNRHEHNFEDVAEIPKNNFVTGIIEDDEKRIWISTNSNGAFCFDPATGVHEHLLKEKNNPNSLSNNSVNDIFEDSEKNIWFSTEGGGITVLDSSRKKFTSFTTANGLPSNFVFKVLEDDRHDMWASTSSGLVRFRQGMKSAAVYTQANGLLNNQFNYHSGYKDNDGRLYFGSVKGMVSFMPDDIHKSDFLPPVYITGMQLFNREIDAKTDTTLLKKSIAYTDEIELPYYQSSLSIDFAALSYVSPEMTAYKYQLEGLDKEWTTIKTNRKVYFTNLSPGHYVFRIKASLNERWSEANERELRIIIMPPLWKTWWAYCLYCLAGILILYYLVRNYHKHQHEKKEKEIYESKIDFFTNVAHEIRTPLTLIKGPVENLMERKDEMHEVEEDLLCLDRNTNRLMNLVSQILDFRQTEIKSFALDFTKVNVSQVLSETFIRYNILAQKKKLDFQLLLPSTEIYALADAEALQKVFGNLIDNAVKYAHSKVTIHAYPPQKESNSFSITFQNDGHVIQKELAEKIFEPFFRIKDTMQQKGTGIGLTLTMSLVELHKGSLRLSFIKKDLNTFVLSLPLQPDDSKAIKPLQETKVI